MRIGASMSKDTKKVSLFIVGQPKSGTTALAHQLNQHPDICMALPKEPHYFATDLHKESDEFHGKQRDFYIRKPEQYSALFNDKKAKILGEASTGYLYSKAAAHNIHAYNPNALIVILLRNPVQLVHSLHMQYVNEATEDETIFEEALKKESSRKQGELIPSGVRTPSYLFYSERIKYAEQVERFIKSFPRENIIIATSEEYQADNSAFYHKVLSHLPVSQSFEPSFERVHDSKNVRFHKLNSFMHTPALRRVIYALLGPRLYTATHKKLVDKLLMKPARRAELKPATKQQLARLALPEVKRLTELLQKDFNRQWHLTE